MIRAGRYAIGVRRARVNETTPNGPSTRTKVLAVAPMEDLVCEPGMSYDVKVEFARGVSVRGRVLDARTGKGIEWIRVDFATPTGHVIGPETEKNGVYTLPLMPGKYEVLCNSDGDKYVLPKEGPKITVTALDTEVLIPDIRLEPRVTGQTDEE